MPAEREGAMPMIDGKRLAAYLILGGILYLPLLTWIPITAIHSHQVVGQTPYWLLWILALLVTASVIGQADGILGVIVAYAALRAVPADWWGSCLARIPYTVQAMQPLQVSCGPFPQGSLEVALLIAIGAAFILMIQHVEPAHTRLAMLTAAAIQGVYVVAQWRGWDPIWRGFDVGTMQLLGTLGQPNYVASVLAIATPLAAWWVWPFGFSLIALCDNLGGLIAATIGICRRYGVSWIIIGIAGAAAFSISLIVPPLSFDERLTVWLSAIRDQTWWTWLIGHGWSSWLNHFASIHPQTMMFAGGGFGQVYMQAHNDFVQAFYEGGAFFIGLIGWWIYSKRACWSGPYGGTAVSVLVVACGFFLFHAAYPGLYGLAAVGMAIRAEREK